MPGHPYAEPHIYASPSATYVPDDACGPRTTVTEKCPITAEVSSRQPNRIRHQGPDRRHSLLITGAIELKLGLDHRISAVMKVLFLSWR